MSFYSAESANMSSPDNLFDDETLHLTPLSFSESSDPYTSESQDPYISLLDFLEDETTGLIPDSMNDTNPLMSSQQSNLVPYQGISLLQNPLEMHQQQHHVLQQQPLENSLDLWLQNNLLDDFNQIEIGQLAQENNGFAHPTMTSSPILPAPLLHGDQFDAFGSYSQSPSLGSQNYPSYQIPQLVTSSVNMYDHQPPPMIFTGRQNEPNISRMVNNSAMISRPVTSFVNMYGRQQPPPSIFIGRQNEPYNLRMVNNPAMTPRPVITSSVNMYGQQMPLSISGSRPNEPQYLRIVNNPTMMPRPVITSYVNMYGPQPPPSIFIGRQNEPHSLMMANNPAMTFPLQNQTNNIMPTFNLAPESNIPSIPIPQVSWSYPRNLDGMQRSVNQSSSRLRFSNLNTPMQIRPYANSIIPPQDGVVGSKRRGYQNRFELGESSSSAQRQRVEPGGQNITSAAVNLVEQRQANNIYNPIYESLGLYVDPHLRNYFFMSTD